MIRTSSCLRLIAIGFMAMAAPLHAADILTPAVRSTVLDAMLAQRSIPDEERGSLRETSRFGTLARRVFQPLLAIEDLR